MKKKELIVKAKNGLDTVKNGVQSINVTDLMLTALKVPGVNINREAYLKRELTPFYNEEMVKLAIENNPAYAGIPRSAIKRIANDAINKETTKVTAISTAASIPGGATMVAAVTVDITQYFAFILRITQKLIYLYGFPEIELKEENMTDETMTEIMLFLGVMFGVQGAQTGVKKLAESLSIKISKDLAKKALTKTFYYPIVKKVAKQAGVKMTKQVFADGVANTIPFISAALSGGLTYASFKPCAIKLRKSLETLNISDPDFYKESQKG